MVISLHSISVVPTLLPCLLDTALANKQHAFLLLLQEFFLRGSFFTHNFSHNDLKFFFGISPERKKYTTWNQFFLPTSSSKNLDQPPLLMLLLVCYADRRWCRVDISWSERCSEKRLAPLLHPSIDVITWDFDILGWKPGVRGVWLLKVARSPHWCLPM